MWGLAQCGQQLFQLAPALVLLQTPPAAAPAHKWWGWAGCAISEVTRPAILKGPMHSHFGSLECPGDCARCFQKSSSSRAGVSCRVALARCENHALWRLKVENSSLIM